MNKLLIEIGGSRETCVDCPRCRGVTCTIFSEILEYCTVREVALRCTECKRAQFTEKVKPQRRKPKFRLPVKRYNLLFALVFLAMVVQRCGIGYE
jgi:hypothetical protein